MQASSAIGDTIKRCPSKKERHETCTVFGSAYYLPLPCTPFNVVHVKVNCHGWNCNFCRAAFDVQRGMKWMLSIGEIFWPRREPLRGLSTNNNDNNQANGYSCEVLSGISGMGCFLDFVRYFRDGSHLMRFCPGCRAPGDGALLVRFCIEFQLYHTNLYRISVVPHKFV